MVAGVSSYLRDPESVDLSAALGVPAFLDPVDCRVEFGVSVGEEHERLLGDLSDAGVLAAPEAWPAQSLAKPVTRIYRRLDDLEVLWRQGLPPDEAERGVKLDVTVLLPLEHLKPPRASDEFPKTIGHYHTVLPGEGVPSPDLYQVVWGQGLILGQASDAGAVRSVAIPVSRGDTVLLPPHLGHLTINIGATPLVFSNVCVRCPHLSYDDGAVTARPNERMRDAGLRLDLLSKALPAGSTMEWLGLRRGDPISKLIGARDDALSVLERPSRHRELFAHALERLAE
jgi:hypothetical protein